MPRDKFYEVPHSSWIKDRRPPNDDAKGKPEEAVRQWCAFELIRAYGYKLSDLEFERAVRVGSKTYRIDVLIVRDGKPFALFECKKRGHRRTKEGLAQAISYATAQQIGCEFAAYTNGETWIVQRNINGSWTAVADLPNRDRAVAAGSIDALLDSVQLLSPILYQLDQPADGVNAEVLFGAMQEYFLCPNITTEQYDEHLLRATDCLLRVIGVGMEDERYRNEKLTAAAWALNAFRSSREIGYPIPPFGSDDDLRTRLVELATAVSAMQKGDDLHRAPDTLLLKLNLALLEYGRTFAMKRGPHPAITPEIYHTLRDVLTLGLAAGFGVHLPTALELTTSSNMRGLCSAAWNEAVATHRRDGK